MKVQRWAVVAVPIRGERQVLERFVTNRNARRACRGWLGNPASRLTVPDPVDGRSVPLVDYIVERLG